MSTDKKIKGIPFPVEVEYSEQRTYGKSELGTTTQTINYITQVPTTAPGYEMLCQHLHQYPICLEKVLVTHLLPNTNSNPGPALSIVITTRGIDYIPQEISYFWWLDPTAVPLSDLENYFKVLRLYSTFPSVPRVDRGIDWLSPRKELQKAIRQHRAFLYAGRSYPSMTAQDREHFLWLAESVPFKLDEYPAVLPDRPTIVVEPVVGTTHSLFTNSKQQG